MPTQAVCTASHCSSSARVLPAGVYEERARGVTPAAPTLAKAPEDWQPEMTVIHAIRQIENNTAVFLLIITIGTP
jgi:hypothetical protein